MPMMSVMDFILPEASNKETPSLSWAATAPLIKAVYFVAASLPDIVACNVPSTAICSCMETPIAVAEAPKVPKALAISEPVVLNIFTAVAVWPDTISTQLAFPISAAVFLNTPYMVPI